MVTVDCIVIKQKLYNYYILLIKRKKNPFKNKWALPGGFININEDLENAAIRELAEETNLHVDSMEQLFTVGTPGRDPRGRTISVIYYTMINNNNNNNIEPIANDDAKDAKWFLISEIPSNLAFDHNFVITEMINRKLKSSIK